MCVCLCVCVSVDINEHNPGQRARVCGLGRTHFLFYLWSSSKAKYTHCTPEHTHTLHSSPTPFLIFLLFTFKLQFKFIRYANNNKVKHGQCDSVLLYLQYPSNVLEIKKLIFIYQGCIKLIMYTKCYKKCHNVTKKIYLKKKTKNMKQLFSPLIIIIINVFWAVNHHIRMISEGSCDTEDWFNYSALITGINDTLHFKTTYFKM